MKSATSTLILLTAIALNASAQKLTLLPQAGIENATTLMQLNEQAFNAPLGNQLSPKFGARLSYQFKGNHGPFAGVSTSRSIAAVDFSSPENGMKIISSSPGNMRLYAEGGYQFSSKPLYFTRAKSSAKSATVQREYRYIQKRCGGYYVESFSAKPSSAPTAAKEKGWYVSIQPLVGAAMMPAASHDLMMNTQAAQNSYQYKAGNWNSAIIAGTGLEFGKNVERKFTVTINYLKGLGNLDTKSIATTSGGKTTISHLSSDVSSWNLTAGIPITLYKKKAAVRYQADVKEKSRHTSKPRNKCGSYKSKCTRLI